LYFCKKIKQSGNQNDKAKQYRKTKNRLGEITMKKILYFVAALVVATTSITTTTSCKFAPDQNDGDTVAASEFYPEDTTAEHAKKAAKNAAAQKAIVDSVGMYYVGSGSTKDKIQLVSYPSRRDTLLYSKTRHVKVKGSADIDHVVRVDFYLLNGKDSLVKYVEEVDMKH